MKKVRGSRKKSYIIQNFDKLSKFRKSCPKQRILLIKNCNQDLTKAFYEGADNILHNKNLLSKSQIKRLKPHADKIRFLCNPRISLRAKKKFLGKPKFSQRGGFIGTLLATLLPIASSVIGNALNRMVGSKHRSRNSRK